MFKQLELFNLKVVRNVGSDVRYTDGMKRVDFKPSLVNIEGYNNMRRLRDDIECMIPADHVIEVTRHIHVWCHSCGAYIGSTSLELKETRHEWDKLRGEAEPTSITKHRADCQTCSSTTFFSVQEELFLAY